jgi:hypothetical protein
VVTGQEPAPQTLVPPKSDVTVTLTHYLPLKPPSGGGEGSTKGGGGSSGKKVPIGGGGGSPQNTESPSLIGSWGSNIDQLTFRDNGSISIFYPGTGKAYQGRYTYTDGILTVMVNAKEVQGGEVKGRVKWVNKNEFIFEGSRGSLTYTRLANRK